MLRTLLARASQLLEDWSRTGLSRTEWETNAFLSEQRLEIDHPSARLGGQPSKAVASALPRYQRLQKVSLTDEVNRLLLEEFAKHRTTPQRNEETGWLLLGHRFEDEAVVLATLPAGAASDTGVAHIRFDATTQALAGRIVRQHDRRLTLLGVLHTHPGSLRHPSDGDYRGDRVWVSQLRGKEGVFGSGTADGPKSTNSHSDGNGSIATKPKPHVQRLGELCLSWYALAEGDRKYRPLPVELTIGPDHAKELRPVWDTLECHAEPLERLCKQLRHLRFGVVGQGGDSFLEVRIELAAENDQLDLLLNGPQVRYYLERADDLIEIAPGKAAVDVNVFRILAELSLQAGG